MNERKVTEILAEEAKRQFNCEVASGIYSRGYNDACTFAMGTLGGVFTAGFLVLKGWNWWNSRKK